MSKSRTQSHSGFFCAYRFGASFLNRRLNDLSNEFSGQIDGATNTGFANLVARYSALSKPIEEELGQYRTALSGGNTFLRGTKFEYLKGADLRAGFGPEAQADAKIVFEAIHNKVTST